MTDKTTEPPVVDAEATAENTGVHVRRRVDSMTSTLEQMRTDHHGLAGEVKILGKEISTLGQRVAHSDGKLSILVRETEHQNKILGEIATTRLQVDAHREVSDIHVSEVRAKTAIEDFADRKKKRRDLGLKLVGFAIGGGSLVELIHMLKGC